MRRWIRWGLAFFATTNAHAQVTRAIVRPDTVDAGGLYTVEYRFTTGRDGIAPGGGVRIEIPVAYAETEFLFWSPPHTDAPTAPGYVWASTSTRVRIRVHVEGLLRGIVQADVDETVSPGATISIFWRGQVQGIAGDIAARFEWRRRAGDQWSLGTQVPTISVKPAAAQSVVVHYPSDLTRATPFTVSIVAFDKYGNLATDYSGALSLQSTDAAGVFPRTVNFRTSDRGRLVIPNVSFHTTGFQKITATDPSKRVATTFKYAMVSDQTPERKHLFGDTHFHTGTGAQNRGFFTNSSGADVNTTGTNTFKELNLAGDHRANFTRAASAYTYARDVMGLDFASTSEHAAPLLSPDAWHASQDVSDAFYKSSAFTTFYAFEWTPDLNHYVVMYKSRDGMPFGHERYPDYSSLVRALDAQRVAAITIPHVSWPFEQHNIWQDSVGGPYRSIGEIYSLWNSRHLVQPDDDPQLFELGAEHPWAYQYAWRRGNRLGLIASSDNHLGHPGANNTTIYVRHSGGLAAVLSTANDRDAIWESLNRRATYATTGTQIYLDFAADGHIMGSDYRTSSPPHLTGRVAGTNRLATVEVVRLAGGKYASVFVAHPNDETYSFDFVDRNFADSAMYYLRVKQVDEYPDRLYAHSTAEMAWSSPIWVEASSATQTVPPRNPRQSP